MQYERLRALAEMNGPDHLNTALSQASACGGEHMLMSIKGICDNLAAYAAVTGNIYRPSFWVQNRERGLFFNLEPNRIETGPHPYVCPVF